MLKKPPSRQPFALPPLAPRHVPLLASAAALSLLAASPPQAADRQGSVPPRDHPPDLQAPVAEAVRRGREALLPRLRDLLEHPRQDYPMGRLALVLAALLKAGTPAEEPAVTDALAALEAMECVKTYGAACYLFALDAYWRALRRGALTGAREADPGPRAAGRVRGKMEEVARWLVAARVRGRGVWTYEGSQPGAQKHDYSNTQFAVLGLHVALAHGIDISRAVFEEIARAFTASQRRTGERRQAALTGAASLEDLLLGRPQRPRRTASAPPGGWDYTARGRSPYASMTAAGASNLLVALAALGDRPSPLGRAAEQALASAYLWIATHSERFFEKGSGLYYTLYSLEKAGDLGGIARFGECDWYAEGARRLLDLERRDGGWGSYVDTALALLFLTRATQLEPCPAPRLATGRGPQGGEGFPRGLAYVDAVKGFLPAAEVLMVVGDRRQRGLIAAAAEVVRNYPARYRGDLVPALGTLWTERDDEITRFARRALEEVTGERRPRCEEYLEWFRRYQEIETLDRDPSAEKLGALLGKTQSVPLKHLILDAIGRHRLAGASAVLVSELEVASPGYRRRVHGILSLLQGKALEGPREDSEAAWAETARRWRELLGERGEPLEPDPAGGGGSGQAPPQ